MGCQITNLNNILCIADEYVTKFWKMAHFGVEMATREGVALGEKTGTELLAFYFLK